VPGCPPIEMEPTWTIMDRKYNPDPATFTHVYGDELAIFQDYVANRKTPDGTGAKGKEPER
jgi:hypothetical protein